MNQGFIWKGSYSLGSFAIFGKSPKFQVFWIGLKILPKIKKII